MDSQLETLLNRLLESERAGHILLDTMSQETADPELKALFANFTDVEVSDTAVLEGLIRLHGGSMTGAPRIRVSRLEPAVYLLPGLQCMTNFWPNACWSRDSSEERLAWILNMEWARAEAIRTGDK